MSAETSPLDDKNEVTLVGKVSATPQVRELPSGDSIVSVRVIVKRKGARPRPNSPTIDTIDCGAWTGRAKKTLERFQPGDVVEVTGALRRRFQRIDGGAISRYEVEVSGAKRLLKAA
ncbi:single-stranded DNA-binding protein [Tenggerimyces flavus]|uniref:Single-stranded DNA-binding protein n=1 Tax=Tenggerimyces flavus TaxID=1708749 RepID=A0ABV7YJI4_9ACTN|nr:single-stranded DNA-binding protein [Tenggerimyces flavus]MBM7787448.1 single-strand DNA-binding protein [Tenggerimyces flavus]